ncbi:unnamed protein product [Acanthoscelides obtectus]|uniref:Uncharacterized protein n=1 Tax=Acanthoscelides obtectus TaxID=200917 RepID=A0A9P0KHY4_ACAOB|nr:unnamed protein product [Acanthoscelides obtectus]CAK1646823.1 hypothetical protein AOBTE_LOCUS14876 [Acanthoscelides obtectus]
MIFIKEVDLSTGSASIANSVVSCVVDNFKHIYCVLYKDKRLTIAVLRRCPEQLCLQRGIGRERRGAPIR